MYPFEKHNNLVLLNLKNKINNFFNSDIHIIFYLLIALINWYFEIIYLIFPIGILLIYLIILLKINRNKIIPIILFSMTGHRLTNIKDYQIPIIIGALLVIPILIYDLFRIRQIKIKSNILGALLVLLFSMILSLITTNYIILTIIGILQMILYVFIYHYLYSHRKDGEREKSYVGKVFVYWGILIFLEFLLNFLSSADFSNPISFITEKKTDLGWGITNFIAIVYLTIIPMTMYYYIKNQEKYFILILFSLEILTFGLMISRSGYLAFLILFIPFSIRVFYDIKDKYKFINYFSLIIIIGLFLVIFFPNDFIKKFISSLNQRGLSLSGRDEIYRNGLDTFKQFPIFGSGVYTSSKYITTGNKYYHNYIIQTFSTLGIVGAIAFSFYIYTLIKECIIKNKYNSYVLFVLLGMLVHGLFDTTFYNPLVMVILSVLLSYMSNDNDVSNYNKINIERMQNA